MAIISCPTQSIVAIKNEDGGRVSGIEQLGEEPPNYYFSFLLCLRNVFDLQIFPPRSVRSTGPWIPRAACPGEQSMRAFNILQAEKKLQQLCQRHVARMDGTLETP